MCSFSDIIYQQVLVQWWMIKEMQSLYKSMSTYILCASWEVTEAKHINSITVHVFVLIQWTSQQVSQPPQSSGSCRAVESTREFCPSFCQHASQTQREQTDLKSESCRAHSKLRSNCLNLALLITHKARISHCTACLSPDML